VKEERTPDYIRYMVHKGTSTRQRHVYLLLLVTSL